MPRKPLLSLLLAAAVLALAGTANAAGLVETAAIPGQGGFPQNLGKVGVRGFVLGKTVVVTKGGAYFAQPERR